MGGALLQGLAELGRCGLAGHDGGSSLTVSGRSERLARAVERLSRLEITRETVTGILGGAGTDEATAGREAGPAAGAADPAPVSSRLAGGSPIGVVTVPSHRPGLAQPVLPPSYRDLPEVLAAWVASCAVDNGDRSGSRFGLSTMVATVTTTAMISTGTRGA